MAMMAMAERVMAMETAMVTAMMPLPPPTATMSMTTTTATQERQLDDGNWTTIIRQQQCDGDGRQQHAECLHVLRHPSKATINGCGQFGEEWFGLAPPKFATKEHDNNNNEKATSLK